MSVLQPSFAAVLDRDAETGAQPLSEEKKHDGLQYFGSRSGWQFVDLAELWRRRDVLGILALRDLKVRYRQTLVGIAWAVLQPLVMLIIFSVLFGLVGHQLASRDVPYALTVLCALAPWQLFANTLTQASGSLVANQGLIGKVYFPRLLLPLAAALPALADFAIGLMLLAGLLAFYGVVPSWPVLAIPALILLTVLAALAAGIWLAALNAIYRDVGFIVPFLLQVGFFVSPVIYQTDALIPERWRPWFALNPLVGLLEGFRWALLPGASAPWQAMLISLLVVLAVLVSGLAYFRRVERFVADRI
jgi:lipopolysaccharide transport system permease protein